MKRFTETTKWRDPWFRRLSPKAKLLWLYCVDHCDCAGVVELDLEAVSFDVGEEVGEKCLKEIGERLQKVSSTKYFIPKFIAFQYGEITASCPAHKPILKAISSHALVRVGLGYQYPSDRLRPIEYPSDRVQEKEKEKEEDKKGGCKGGEPTVPYREPTGEHAAFIKGWCENFKTEHGVEYRFERGRDGKAVKELLSIGVLRIDLLEKAKQAWKRAKQPPRVFHCEQASTIHGFNQNYNQINVELKNGTNQGNRQQGNRPLTGAEQRQVGIPVIETVAAARARRAAEAAQNGVATTPPAT